MRKVLFLSMILVLAALAQAETVIGVFATEDATGCDVAVVPYVPTVVHVVATWDPGALDDGITAAEFKLAGLPTSDGYPFGTVTPTHTTDLVIGNLWTDYSAAWSEPQGGGGAGMFAICSIEILSFDAAWIGPDTEVLVSPGDDCGCMVLVDALFEVHDAMGGLFTINCSEPPCACFPPTAVESSSWSSVKALF